MVIRRAPCLAFQRGSRYHLFEENIIVLALPGKRLFLFIIVFVIWQSFNRFI